MDHPRCPRGAPGGVVRPDPGEPLGLPFDLGVTDHARKRRGRSRWAKTADRGRDFPTQPGSEDRPDACPPPDVGNGHYAVWVTNSQGTFVAFEGPDAAGKSTQVARLAERLRSAGREVVATFEPGDSRIGPEVRHLVLDVASDGLDVRAEALLYAADRAEHVAAVIRPALERGAVVITDRYVDSSIAYQGAGRDLGRDEIAELSAFATRGLVPDLTIVLDVPADVRRARIGTDVDRLEGEAEQFHERVRQAFLDRAAAEPDRYLVVDGTHSADELSEVIAEAVEKVMIE